jgi:hypothetical protein
MSGSFYNIDQISKNDCAIFRGESAGYLLAKNCGASELTGNHPEEFQFQFMQFQMPKDGIGIL